MGRWVRNNRLMLKRYVFQFNNQQSEICNFLKKVSELYSVKEYNTVMITAKQIIEISKRNLSCLEGEFQPMTETGKIECLTYNALVCNFSAQSKYTADALNEVNGDLFALLIGELKLHVDETNDDKLGDLIESRFAIHSKDIVMLLDGGAQHDPENTFFFFYKKPLTRELPEQIDPALMATFKPLLIKMTNAVLEEADNLPD